MAKKVIVGGRIESKEVGGIVTGAAEILDDSKGKKQSVINQETDNGLLRLDQSKQDNLTFDNVPTEGSNNPVKSAGVYAADKELSDAIEAILLLIPGAASALNKLVDMATMNSSISTATATFKGTYNVVTDLELAIDATHEQIAAKLAQVVSEADNNDYAFVQIPVSAESTDIRRTERYKFNGTAWAYEYDLNTSGFTAAQWAAINSGITIALVAKLNGLPTSSELMALLGQKQDTLTFDNIPTSGSNNPVKSGGVYSAINDEKTAREQLAQSVAGINGRLGNVEEVIPSGAAANNKLVANNSMEAYVASIIDAITASFTIATADGHINLTLTQTNGRVASLTLTSSDIASAQALTALTGRVSTSEGNITSLGGRVSTNETDIANLQQLYNNLQQSKPVAVTALPETGQQQGVIYRLAGTTSYSDYMWNGSTWVLMATYNNAIDPRPKKASQNLVTSGGVFDNMGALDVSELNATENPHTLAQYVDLSAALAAIPTDYQKGGMSIKFVQSSDNKYVQHRLMSDTFNTTPSNWQGVDEEPTAGSNNLVKSGGVYNSLNFFELVERHELYFGTWGNNVGVTRVETSIMGKTENVQKIDFHINNTNVNTLGISFRPSFITINEGDIVNFAVCFYCDDEVERSYELGIYDAGFSGTFTLLTPKVLNVKKGFNYFFLSIRSTFTQVIGASGSLYQVYFKDNSLDGKTWYAKAYWYIGTPNQKLLIPFDSTLVEDSKNLVRGGDIKRYVDDNISEVDRYLKQNIFYYLNSDTLRIEYAGNHGYTLTKYDKYYSVSYNHVDEEGYSVGNILLGYAKDFRNGNRIYIRYDVKVFHEIHIIKTIPSQWVSPSLIGDGVASIKSIEGGNYIDYSQSVLDAIENLSDDTPIVLAFGVNDGNSSQYSSLDGKTGIFRVSNAIPEKFNYEENKILRVDKVENDVKAVEQRVEDIEEQIGISKKVVCWGDSLTAGAGSQNTTNVASVKAVIEAKGYSLPDSTYNYVTMLQALLGIDYNTINSGVGGENINTISARQGGNLAVFSDIVELPADTSVVNVSRPISSFDRSSMVNVLLQGDKYVNPCYIQGIPCTLSVIYDAGYTNVQYRLKRNEAGDRAVTLPQYTPIVMQGSKLNPVTDIAVLWCWQNGGYSTNEELVEKLKNMISHLHTTKYLLIGLHSRSLNSGNVQEALLEKTFGDKFFNWRQYASTNALYDFGITPTTEDITAMGTGSMPPSLLEDAVHLNSAGYMILGWKLYERMKNIGYID